MIRPDWDTTWLEVTAAIAKRSSCARRQIGAVIVTGGNRIVATGYNGPPANLPGRCMTDCPRNLYAGDPPRDYDNCISIHAEANALMFCDRRDRDGGTIYVSEVPCYTCAKLISNSGLAKVVIDSVLNQEHRTVEDSLRMMMASGLQIRVLSENGWSAAPA